MPLCKPTIPHSIPLQDGGAFRVDLVEQDGRARRSSARADPEDNQADSSTLRSKTLSTANGTRKREAEAVHLDKAQKHFISERFEDRVAAILGDPEIDPHGHIIPQKYGGGVYRDEVPLARWPLQTPGTISSVSDRNPAALRELEQLGLKPGTVLTVERRNSASSLSVRLAGRADAIRVSHDLADCISVIAADA